MGSGKKVTIGYKYYLDIHMGVARGPIDELVAIEVDEKVLWEGSATESGQIHLDKSKLFGGEKKEGGIQGPLDVMMGEPTQEPVPGLVKLLKKDVPGFRGLCTLFFSGYISAMNWNIKEWRLHVRRAKKGWDGPCWYPERAQISMADGKIKAMNPAHIVFECLTNRDWGGGVARVRLNDASFRAAADTLYSEGFGLCLLWAREEGVDNFLESIMEHISGTMYQSRTDGQVYIKLFRGDYDPQTIPKFSPDTGLLEIEDDRSGGGSGTTNEIIVKWKDALRGEERQTRERNIAAIHSDGCITSESTDFPGIPTQELANRVALRELTTRAGGLKAFKVRLDRRGYMLNPGDVFCVSDPRRGLDNIVLRVARFEDGTLEDATITIEALQDVFGMPATAISVPEAGGWVAPDYTPKAAENRKLFEVSWRDLTTTHSPADIAQTDRTTAFVATAASRATPTSYAYILQTRVSPVTFTDKDVDSYTPTALLAGDLGRLESSCFIVEGEDLDLVQEGSAALIGEEIIRVDTINLSTGAITFSRGCADTVPARHTKNSRIWFYENAYAFDPNPYGPGTTVQAKLLPQTSIGALDAAQAPTDSLTTQRRILRPYPPSNVRIGGQLEPTSINGPIAVTWAHRDKLLQADQLVPWTSGSIGPEPGTTYSLRLTRKDNGAQLATKTGVEGNSIQFDPVQYTGAVILEVWSVLEGMESLQRWRVEFAYTPV